MKYTISLGDMTPVIYGGFLVDEETGEAIFWYEPTFDIEDKPEKPIKCYQFTIAPNAIEDLNWLKPTDWKTVGDFVGEKYITLMAISNNISDRARVYEAVGLHYGFDNLDGSPNNYTYAELLEMYPN